VTLKLHRPGPEGLEENPVQVRNWRGRLRSRRWQPAKLENPEARPTSARMAVAFWLGLAALTFFILVTGYGLGIWTMPTG